MIGFWLLLAAAQAAASTPAAPALGPIGRQQLPAKGCAAFLWSERDRQLVAMAVAEPGTIRLSLDGRTVDLARSGVAAGGGLGFDPSARYADADGDIAVTLDMAIVPRENLTAGAQVPNGTLTVERRGADTLVEPVAGLIGCTA